MRLDLWKAEKGKYVVIVLAVPIKVEQQIPNSISWRWGGSVSTNHLWGLNWSCQRDEKQQSWPRQLAMWWPRLLPATRFAELWSEAVNADDMYVLLEYVNIYVLVVAQRKGRNGRFWSGFSQLFCTFLRT